MTIFLATNWTESIWLKRKYLKWFVGLITFTTLLYFGTPLKSDKDFPISLLMPFNWLFLCFISDIIFQLFFTKEKKIHLYPTEKNTLPDNYIVFATFSRWTLSPASAEKLRRPTTIDIVLSVVVYIGVLYFTVFMTDIVHRI